MWTEWSCARSLPGTPAGDPLTGEQGEKCTGWSSETSGARPRGAGASLEAGQRSAITRRPEITRFLITRPHLCHISAVNLSDGGGVTCAVSGGP